MNDGLGSSHLDRGTGRRKLRLLVLGGTGEARSIAQALTSLPPNSAVDLTLISSLAGRTQDLQLPPGLSRVGGFGGEVGLADYLRQERIEGVVEATHPFAVQLSRLAVRAAQLVGVRLVRLVRPAWVAGAGDRWLSVADHAGAVALLRDLGAEGLERVFLTIGRQGVGAYAGLQSFWFLMRMIDPPEGPVPPGEICLARGPFTLDQERALLVRYGLGAIVTKNSGGAATEAKLVAARELGLPVVMIERPPVPEAEQVTSVAAAIAWIAAL